MRNTGIGSTIEFADDSPTEDLTPVTGTRPDETAEYFLLGLTQEQLERNSVTVHRGTSSSH